MLSPRGLILLCHSCADRGKASHVADAEDQGQMDMRTLLLERACLLTFCMLLVLLNLRSYRNMNGIRWFAASNIGYFIGGILIASRDHLPIWAAVVLSNLLYSLGYVLLHRCLAAFFGEKRWYWRGQCAAAVASLLLCLHFTYIHPDLRLRLAFIGLTTGLQFAMAAAVALHGRRSAMRSAALAMSAVLVFSSGLNLLRVFLTLALGTTQTYLGSGQVQTTIVMLNTTIFVAMDIAFLWMIATSLRNELQQQAMTDPLTKVMNRRALEAALGRLVNRCRQTGQPLSMVMLDLDEFKRINDTLGHRMGDRALMAVADCLREGLRDSDLIARFGGDEFVLLLPNCPRNGAHEIAERLRTALEQKNLVLSNEPVHLKASFGVTTLEEPEKDWETLLIECDRALYTAKQVGGNFVYVTG